MSQIPSIINEIFQELQTETSLLHMRWIIYRQLFADSKKRLELLETCAPLFFGVIGDILFWETQLTLCKLTDPAYSRAGSGMLPNLSLEQLQTRIEAQGKTKLAAILRTLLDDLHNKCIIFRKHRNKRLSHLDFATALQIHSNPLPGVSRKMIEDAMKLIREYMNKIEIHYTQSETNYQLLFMSGDGKTLVALLEDGLRYRELLRDHWEDIKNIRTWSKIELENA